MTSIYLCRICFDAYADACKGDVQLAPEPMAAMTQSDCPNCAAIVDPGSGFPVEAGHYDRSQVAIKPPIPFPPKPDKPSVVFENSTIRVVSKGDLFTVEVAVKDAMGKSQWTEPVDDDSSWIEQELCLTVSRLQLEINLLLECEAKRQGLTGN